MNEELDRAKRELLAAIARIDRSMQGHRTQMSAEHSAQDSKLSHLVEMVVWLKTKWEKFTRSPDPHPPEKNK